MWVDKFIIEYFFLISTGNFLSLARQGDCVTKVEGQEDREKKSLLLVSSHGLFIVRIVENK